MIIMEKGTSEQILLLTPKDVQAYVRNKYQCDVETEKIIPGEIRSGSRWLPVEVLWKVALSEDKTVLLDFDGVQADWPTECFCKISSDAAYILKNGSYIRYDSRRKNFVNKVEANVTYSRLDQHFVESL